MRLPSLKLTFLVILLGSLTISAVILYFLFHPQENPTEETIPCPPTPKNILEASKLKHISVDAYSTLLSDTITSKQDIGYIFKADAGQKIQYNKLNDVCVWIFTPDNKIMTDSTFPLDGKYIMQVATLKKSVDFYIYVSLEVDPNIKEKIDENLLKSSPEPSPTPDTISSDENIFTELLDHHFSSLNNQNYDDAWSDLSPNFQQSFGDPASYGSIWQSLNNIELLGVTVVSQTTNKASLTIQIKYSSDNTATGDIELIFDNNTSRWLIDAVKLKSD